MAPENKPSSHIAIVGITGVGKSTLLNVLMGSDGAKANNNAVPCTGGRRRYDIQDRGVTYGLWDTRGLNEASEKEATSSTVRFLQRIRILPDAERKLRKFLGGTKPEIKLVLFCIQAEKIRIDAHWKIYNKIRTRFCREGTKVAVVVTRIRSESSDTLNGGEWRATCWQRANGAVGIDFVPDFGESEVARDECRSRILKLIVENSMSST